MQEHGRIPLRREFVAVDNDNDNDNDNDVLFSLALNCLYLYSAPLDPYLVDTCSSQFNQTRSC
jgi:hypothetical protein